MTTQTAIRKTGPNRRYKWNMQPWFGKMTEVQRRYVIRGRNYGPGAACANKHGIRYELSEMNTPWCRYAGLKDRIIGVYASNGLAIEAAERREPWQRVVSSLTKWWLGSFIVQCKADKNFAKANPDRVDSRGRAWLLWHGRDLITTTNSGIVAQQLGEQYFLDTEACRFDG